MRCIWCNGGSGRNHSKDKAGKIHYYVCIDCVGLFIKEQDSYAKELLEDTIRKNEREENF